jgi:mannose/fructose-specific phosphotransferase system component IIA
MNGKKQSRLDLLEKKNNELDKVVKMIIGELTNVRTLSIGTLETIKQMTDYEEAIAKLSKSED